MSEPLPLTDESEIDDPTTDTEDPYASLEVRPGIGYHDDEAPILDTDAPDVDNPDEPTIDEPEEEEASS